MLEAIQLLLFFLFDIILKGSTAIKSSSQKMLQFDSPLLLREKENLKAIPHKNAKSNLEKKTPMAKRMALKVINGDAAQTPKKSGRTALANLTNTPTVHNRKALIEITKPAPSQLPHPKNKPRRVKEVSDIEMPYPKRISQGPCMIYEEVGSFPRNWTARGMACFSMPLPPLPEFEAPSSVPLEMCPAIDFDIDYLDNEDFGLGRGSADIDDEDAQYFASMIDELEKKEALDD